MLKWRWVAIARTETNNITTALVASWCENASGFYISRIYLFLIIKPHILPYYITKLYNFSYDTFNFKTLAEEMSGDNQF